MLEIVKYSIDMFGAIITQAFNKIITQLKKINNTITEINSLTIIISIDVAKYFYCFYYCTKH